MNFSELLEYQNRLTKAEKDIFQAAYIKARSFRSIQASLDVAKDAVEEFRASSKG